MNEQERVCHETIKYFTNLGYSELTFENDFVFSNHAKNKQLVDFIIRKNGKPFIIVEMKLFKSFENIDKEKLKYDPSVRQAQTYAMSLDAQYFVVTNGISFLWFETNDDGRPCKIDPVPLETNITSNNESYISFLDALTYCKDLLKQDAKTSDIMYEISLLLLARFAVKDTVGAHEISHIINQILYKYYTTDIQLVSNVDSHILEKCWDIFERCSPEYLEPRQLITYLRLFNKKLKNNGCMPRFGETLSRVLSQLASINENSIILDPAANVGEITSEILLNKPDSTVFSYCQSKEMYVFELLLQKIICENSQNVKLTSFTEFIQSAYMMNHHNFLPDRIITVLPFGSRFNKFDLQYVTPIPLTNIEDYMLLASLKMLNANGRLVAIVPDKLLFGEGKRKLLRKYIIQEFCLKSVISLPIGAISESNIKTSIIIIDKFPKKTHRVFFGIIKSLEMLIETNSEKKLLLAVLLNSYRQFINGDNVEENDYCKIVTIDNSVENLGAEKYLSISDYPLESKYPLYPINQICTSITRGTALKLDPNGDIPVIGPAAIRPNIIDESKYTFTSMQHVSKSFVYAQKNTVVFNNISSYLGASALVLSEAPIAINQHVLLLTPNTKFLLPQYLVIALNSKMVKDSIIRASTGTVIPSITLSNLKSIEVPIPDLEIQHKIVDSVNKIQSQIEKFEAEKKTLESRLIMVVNNLDFEEV